MVIHWWICHVGINLILWDTWWHLCSIIHILAESLIPWGLIKIIHHISINDDVNFLLFIIWYSYCWRQLLIKCVICKQVIPIQWTFGVDRKTILFWNLLQDIFITCYDWYWWSWSETWLWLYNLIFILFLISFWLSLLKWNLVVFK